MAVTNVPAMDIYSNSGSGGKQPAGNGDGDGNDNNNSNDDGDMGQNGSANGNANGNESAEPMPEGRYQLYFDTLDKDALEVAVRWLSKNPQGDFWARNLEVGWICPFFKAHRELGNFVRGKFDALGYCRMWNIWSVISSQRWIKRTEWLLRTEDRDEVRELLRLNGPNFKTVILGDYNDDHTPGIDHEAINSDTRALISEFAERCPNLENLCLGKCGKSWFRALGGRLSAIKIGRFPDIADIAAHCRNLKEISLKGIRQQVIESTNLWEAIGGTLETLRLEFDFDDCTAEIHKMHQFCRAAKKVHINGHQCTKEALADMLVSYGSQLEYADLRHMNAAQLKRVADNCPAAQFGYLFWHEADIIEALKILGPRLLKAILVCRADNDRDDWAALAEAWGACRIIEKVRFEWRGGNWLGSKDFEAFAHIRKDSLKFVEMHIPIENPDVKKICDYLANGTSAVERMSVGCEEPEDLDTFDRFIYANRNALKCFSLPCIARDDGGMTKQKGTQLFERFMKLAPHLDEIYIKDDVWENRIDLSLLSNPTASMLRGRRFFINGI